MSAGALRQILNQCPDLSDVILQAFIARRQLLRESEAFTGTREHDNSRFLFIFPFHSLTKEEQAFRLQNVHRMKLAVFNFSRIAEQTVIRKLKTVAGVVAAVSLPHERIIAGAG